MKKYPFFLILAPMFPVLTLFSANLDIVTVRDGLQCLGLVWAVTGVLFLLLLALFRQVNKAAIASTLLILLLLSYGHFIQIWPNFSFRLGVLYIGPNKLLTIFLFLLYFTFLYFFFKTKKKFNNVALLNFMAVILVIMPLVSIVLAPPRKSENVKHQQTHSVEPATTQFPPIYYFILDAYTRADILREIYAYDNTPFLNSLREKGFYIADSSYSNYAWTMMSIPSSLNFEYLQDIPQDRIEFGNYTEHLVNQANIAQELQKLGYQTVAFDNSNFRWTTMHEADNFITSPGHKMNLLLNRLLHMTPLPYLPFLKAWSMKPQLLTHYHKNLFVFDTLEKMAADGDRSFYFVHFLAAHRPFVYDADGNFNLPEDEFATFYSEINAYTDENLQRYKKYYTDQVTFYSNRLLQFIDELLKNSPVAPVIILQADHGTASQLSIANELTNAALKERFAIFNALYFPDQNYEHLEPDMTPVNSFRIVLNDFFNYNKEILQNRNLFSSGPRKTDFINVTQQLRDEQ